MVGQPATTSTIWQLVENAARSWPHEIVLADDHGRSLTFARFRDAAERCAAGLFERGIRPGQVVSWQLPTTLEAAVLLAACARLGVVQNPIIPVLREREVGLIAGQVRSRLFIVPEVWRGFEHGAMARALVADVFATDFAGPPGQELRLPAGEVDALPPAVPEPSDCRWIYYSSGTTSEPKGARHTDASLLASSNGMVDELRICRADVYPIAWPITHIGGIAMLISVLRVGGRLIMFDTFDPGTSPDRMALHRPTILGSATPFFKAYLAAQRRHGAAPLFPELRVCTGGGAPVPPEVSREVSEVLGVPGIAASWGLTEFPVATCERVGEVGLGQTVGYPAAGVQARVVDGELRLKGPQCFAGYVDAALDTAAFDDGGWFRTGDLGTIDDRGRVSITGRFKDVIIRNAENISASEVEDVLLRHAAIADAAVVGLPDARTGERVCAVVVLEAGLELTLAQVADHCLVMGLARFKCPEQLHLVPALPRNAMGKILKSQLQSQLQS
jgi:cyclohexanecarboxylate-CoA ligase